MLIDYSFFNTMYTYKVINVYNPHYPHDHNSHIIIYRPSFSVLRDCKQIDPN